MNAIIFALFFSIFHPFESKNEWEIILFKKTNCTLCYFVELEFKRTDLIFNGQISKKRPGKGQNKKNNLSFYIIDCNRRQRMCSSYDCFGVPTIILSNKKNKQIYRYNDEKSALCERLTKFIINKTNIQPRNKYYLDIFNDITKEQNEEIFENKIDEMISHYIELDVVNFSYVHQYDDLLRVKHIVSTGRCVALALPIHGMIPIHTRLIFDNFFKEHNFFPIVIQNRNSYRLEENLRIEVDIILFTSRGSFPVYVNNSIPNIIDFINYVCFVEGRQKLRQFVEMIIHGETQKTISIIENNLMMLKSHNFSKSSSKKTSSSSMQSSQSKEKYSTDSTDSSDSTSKIPISSSPENFDDQYNNLILPYEFRHFAEEPEKLISFAKMMYANNDLMHVINSINQLRNTIMHGNIKKSIEEKLSQRIIVLNVIKQIFFENFISKRLKNEKPYHHI